MNTPMQTSNSRSKYSLSAPDEYAYYWVPMRVYENSDGETDLCKAFRCYFKGEDSHVSVDQSKNFRPSDTYRSVFAKDRDRIMYCAPFARLAGKTQIFRTGENDHLRNRMTHTLEVSQISRTLARALNLDVDLAEAIALGHDIGHTPFGHIGERVLNFTSEAEQERKIIKSKHNDVEIDDECRQGLRGFKHNHQSVRVIYEQSKKIRITNFTLFGICEHSKCYWNNDPDTVSFYKEQYEKVYKLPNGRNNAWSFEAYIVRWADEIAQRHHDLEDAYRWKLLSIQEICKLLESDLLKDKLLKLLDSENRSFFEQKLSVLRDLPKGSSEELDTFERDLSSLVVDIYVTVLHKLLQEKLDKFRRHWSSREEFVKKYLEEDENEVREEMLLKDSEFVEIDETFQKRVSGIILRSFDVQRMDGKGSFIVKKLVHAYITNPQQLPDSVITQLFHNELPRWITKNQLNTLVDCAKSQEKNISEWGLVDCRSALECIYSEKEKTVLKMLYPHIFRVIFDYIAGMTDNFAIEEYKNLY